MDSNSRYQLQQQQINCGSFPFQSVKQTGEGQGAANNPWVMDSEPERLVLRFMNSGNSNNDSPSPSLREFMDKPLANESSSSVLRLINCQQSYATSSSAGHFSFQNGYDSMKGFGDYSGVNEIDGELSLSMNQISFSSRRPSSLGMLSQISKMGNEVITHERRQGSGKGDAGYYYSPGFPYGSCKEISHHSDKLIGKKREQNSNHKLFFDPQNGEVANQVYTLSNHLSLPSTSSEMFSVENMVQFQEDIVPCKIRAKRGFATHPRSIAERVRRTRINERMRKLQEHVPNMEKQTSTADMLDLAIEYIKDLQNEFKTLNEKREKCKCIRKSQTNQIA